MSAHVLWWSLALVVLIAGARTRPRTQPVRRPTSAPAPGRARSRRSPERRPQAVLDRIGRRMYPPSTAPRPGRWRPPPHVLGAAAVLSTGAVLVAGPIGAALGLVPVVSSMRRSRRAQHTARAVAARAVPDLVDLLLVAGSAGMPAAGALRAAAVHAPPPLGPALARRLERVDQGEPLRSALEVSPPAGGALDPVDECLRPVLVALDRAHATGTPLLPVLERLASDARSARRREAEAAARKLAVRLLFPLVSCVLPALVLLTVVPLFAASAASFRLR